MPVEVTVEVAVETAHRMTDEVAVEMADRMADEVAAELAARASTELSAEMAAIGPGQVARGEHEQQAGQQVEQKQSEGSHEGLLRTTARTRAPCPPLLPM